MADNQNLKEEAKRKNRRQRRVVIGVLVSVLVVVGIVSLMNLAVKLTRNIFDDTQEKLDFENRISTLVMLEILPFDSIKSANEDTIMQACIWSVLFNDDLSKLAKDEISGGYIIPAVDVDRYATKLFGPKYKLNHHEFTASDGLVFLFDETAQTYTMPVTGMVSNYTPEVEVIKTSRGVKRVTVGYIPPSSSEFSGLGAKEEKQLPSKYYDYIFTKQDKEYFLSSIEESEMKPQTPSNSAEITLPAEAAPENDPNQVVEEVVGALDNSMTSEAIVDNSAA